MFEKIKRLLRENAVNFEVREHAPVFTSEQAAKVRGESMSKGAKSLLIKAGDEFVLVVLPGDKRLSSKKVKKVLGVKSIRFATPEEVKEKMGCEIGACYPIGVVVGLKTIADSSFLEDQEISFNPSVHDKSIDIKWSDYLKVANPVVEEVSE